MSDNPNNDFDWDDTVLIRAYDNSLSLESEELARRIASKTNNRMSAQKLKQAEVVDDEKMDEIAATAPTSTTATDKIDETKSYKVGDYVRATYEDGVDYEAKILSISEDNLTCLLRYVGYENEQEVYMSELIDSWGKNARRTQVVEAKGNDTVAEPEPNGLPKSLKTKEERKSKSGRSSVAASSSTAAAKAAAAAAAAAANCSGNLGGFNNYAGMQSMLPPPPAPPMPGMLPGNSEDSEYLAAIMMSWYMSGYYTGLYQGKLNATAAANKSKK